VSPHRLDWRGWRRIARAPALSMAVAAGALAAGPARHTAPDAPAPVPHRAEAPGPAREMSLEQAYAAAERLVASRRDLESLPYFRRMGELISPDVWSLHHDFANALQGASLESRRMREALVPATRSSVERIELATLAQSELDRAAALAHEPAEQAAVHLSRARQLGTWGFPLDALSELAKATAADPTWALAPASAREWALRHASLLRAARLRSGTGAPRGRR
jgi:hypothetical protein